MRAYLHPRLLPTHRFNDLVHNSHLHLAREHPTIRQNQQSIREEKRIFPFTRMVFTINAHCSCDGYERG